jgi:N-acetyl sugar amidotransferase
MTRAYQICTRCIMDTTDPKITFDANGLCTHCRRYTLSIAAMEKNDTYSTANRDRIIGEIREAGRDRDYDVLLGLSGGVDSSYLAYLAHQLGFRAVCVHLDNGWNSELAVKNIENIVRRYHFTLHTHVINWEEFRDLQLSCIKASVVDVEMLTDQAIGAVMFEQAARHDIKNILIGLNWASEAIMPYSWKYYKNDLLNILDIHRRFGTHKIETFPMLDPYRMWEYKEIKGIRMTDLLNYYPYNPRTAPEVLQKEQGWRPYGRKHCESIFTQFYQEYYLPRKFNIDKRRPHLANLVCSGIMTRDQALAEFEQIHISESEAEALKDYVCKKLRLTQDEFSEIMAAPRREHTEFLSSFPPLV